MSVNVDNTSMSSSGSASLVRYLSRKESVIRTSHNHNSTSQPDYNGIRTKHDMKSLYTGYEPVYTTGRIPGSVYKTKTRVEKRVRFAVDSTDHEQCDDSTCACDTPGRDKCTCDTPPRDKCTCDMPRHYLEPRKSPKSRFDSYYHRKLKDSAGTNLTNGVSRESSFTLTSAPQRASKALAEGIVRKQGSEGSSYSPSPRQLDTQSPRDYPKHTPTPLALQTVISPELTLGARSFTTLLDDVLRDKTNQKDISRFSRYRPAVAYSPVRQRELPRDAVPKVRSAHSGRLTTVISLRNTPK